MDSQQATFPLSPPQIAGFWQEFLGRLPALEALSGVEFVESANDLLHPIAPGLSLEREEPGQDPAGRLVVTAHGSIEQFENVQALVRQAPPIPGYALQAFRSRNLGGSFAMRMQDFELSCADVLVAHYDAGGVVGLELGFGKTIPQDMRDHARHMAFIMLDHVLGEWDFAVRVGPVDFVEGFSGEPVPLSDFVPVFDAFMHEALGRSYELPAEQDESWMMLEVRGREASADAPPDLLSFRASANAVATRADLPYFVTLELGFESQEQLDQVRDAQDALGSELERLHLGLLVFTRVQQMSARVAACYVSDAQAATALMQHLATQYAPAIEAQVAVAYDPAWQEFLGLYAAVSADAQD